MKGPKDVAVLLTLVRIMPPKLCAMKIMGLSRSYNAVNIIRYFNRPNGRDILPLLTSLFASAPPETLRYNHQDC